MQALDSTRVCYALKIMHNITYLWMYSNRETIVVSTRWLVFITLFSENFKGRKFRGFAIF